jgi:uncharacterized protein
MKLLLCLLGLLLIVEGIPYFAFPGAMKKWMAQVQRVPDSTLRVAGLFAMVAGLVVTYLCRR